MVSGTKFYKVLEILSCVRGCPKYVINITFVELRLVSLVIFKHLPLDIANEEASIVWAHFRSHGYAPNLLVVFVVKFKRTVLFVNSNVCFFYRLTKGLFPKRLVSFYIKKISTL